MKKWIFVFFLLFFVGCQQSFQPSPQEIKWRQAVDYCHSQNIIKGSVLYLKNDSSIKVLVVDEYGKYEVKQITPVTVSTALGYFDISYELLYDSTWVKL